MKKLDVSACTSTNILFTKSGTFEFLQLSYREICDGIIKGLIGNSYDSAKVYRLSGAELTNIGADDFTVSEGYVFHNGEIYKVDAVGGSGVNLSGLYIYMIPVRTQYNIYADPTDFSDGVQRDVHNIYEMEFTSSDDPSDRNDVVDFILINPRVESRVFADPLETVYMDRNRSYFFTGYEDPLGGAHHYTISFPIGGSLVVGSEINIYTPVGTLDYPVLDTPANSVILKLNSTPSFTPSGNLLIKIKYIGNDGTDNYFTLEMYKF
jgi:hypothetical protein